MIIGPGELERLAMWAAWPYRNRSDIDDIRQEARIGAWRSATTASGCAPGTAARRGARWAILDYLRHRPGGTLYVSGRPCSECALAIMQSGIRRLVWYAETTAHGHAGDSDDELWESYGVPIERVAYTDDAWEALYK